MLLLIIVYFKRKIKVFLKIGTITFKFIFAIVKICDKIASGDDFMKKILSIALALIMTLTLCLPAFADEPKTAFIVVSGMNTFGLSYDNGDSAFPPPTDSILKLVAKALPPVLSFLVTGDYEALGDGIIPPVYEMFSPLAFDKNGDSINKINAKTFDDTLVGSEEYFMDGESNEFATVRAGIEKFGIENTFFFNYDWREDPLEHTDRLNEMIKHVKETTDCDRIALAAFSMGGTVIMSYLYKYGSADLDSVIMCSTAFQGTSCVGSLLSADFSLSLYELLLRLALLTRDNTAENFVMYLSDALEASGVNASIEDFANGITDNLLDRIYADILIPVFGYMPGIWSLVPDKNYTAAKACMLDENENAELIKRLDEYHYNVQKNAANLLKEAQKDTKVYILAQYNWPTLPVSENIASQNSDNLIDVEYASGGAISAPLGGTLGEGYTQKIPSETNYLSADGMIDASTCMLPEYTWFFRDMGHVDYPYGESTDFIMHLAESEEYLNIHSEERYPQFMVYDYDNGKLLPLTEENLAPTTADEIFDVLTKITVFLISFAMEFTAKIFA